MSAAAPTDPKLDPPIGNDELGRIGHYRIQSIIGRGGMGVVYRAEDTRLRRVVALKVTTGKLAATQKNRHAFLEEARSMAAVDHDNVATIYEVGSHATTPYLAMELLRGETLGDLIRRKKRQHVQAIRENQESLKLKSTTYIPGLFAPEFIADIARQTCAGLVAAHARGIIHCDIKPANLWLQPIDGQPDRPRVKILDFGLAIAGTGEAIGGETVVGTPGYLSPEQARNDPVDARTDLYSLAVVMTEMAVGRVPILRSSVAAQMIAILCEPVSPISQIDPSFPKPLSELIVRLLSKEPADRPATAKELIRLIDEAVESSTQLADVDLRIQLDEPSGGGPNGLVKKRGAAALSKRKPLTLVAAGCGVLTLIALGWWALLGPDRRPAGPAIATTQPATESITASSLSALKLTDTSGDPEVAQGEPARFVVSLLNGAVGDSDDPRLVHSGSRRVARIATYLRPIGWGGPPAADRRTDAAYPRFFSSSQLPRPGRLEKVDLQFLTADLPQGDFEVEFELQTPAGEVVDWVKTNLSVRENLLQSELLGFEAIAVHQGGGADTTIFKGRGQPAGTDGVVQTIGGNDPAHVYLRFDLTTIADRSQIDRAVLRLTVQKGGFEFEDHVGVHGWSGPQSDAWTESGQGGLVWNTAPSGIDRNPQTFEGLVYLGSMRVDNRGDALAGKPGELRFASESLDRLLREASGRTATIVLAARFAGNMPLGLVAKEQSPTDCAVIAVRLRGK